METIVIKKKRKLIDLPLDVDKRLSVMAAAQGKSLKVYIEAILERQSRRFNEDAILAELSMEPEANIPLEGKELKEFEKWLGV